jgi:hypothetical protein
MYFSSRLYSRGYKKRAIAEKMFGTLAIFSDSLKGCFPLFSFFCYQRTANLHMESFFLNTHHRATTKEGRKVEPFLKYNIFLKVVSPKYH